MSEQDTVFLVDGDAGFRRALTRTLGAAGLAVREFASATAFLCQHDPDQPGCALLDMRLPDLNGLALQKALLAAGDRRPVIFMARYGDVAASVCAMKAGATDFLTKPFDDTALLAALYEALARDRRAREIASRLDAIRCRLAALTPREHEVMRHVVEGRLNKQIASELGIAEKTIKVHRARAMEKMCAKSVADLVRQTLEFRLGMVLGVGDRLQE